MLSHIDHMHMASHLYGCVCGLWDYLAEQMPSHIDHMHMVSYLYGCVCGLWDYLAEQMPSHIDHMHIWLLTCMDAFVGCEIT